MAKRKFAVVELNINLTSTQDMLLKELSTKKSLSNYQKARIKEFQKFRNQIKEIKRKATKAKEQFEIFKAAKAYTNISNRKLNKIKNRYSQYLLEARNQEAIYKQKLFRFLGIKKSGIQSKKGRQLIRISKSGMVKLEVGFFNKLDKLLKEQEQQKIKKMQVEEPDEDISEDTSSSRYDIQGLSCIGSYEQFKKWVLTHSARFWSVLWDYDVSYYFMAFLGDTSAAWARRVMNALDICPHVDRQEFYDWILQLKAEGLIK